MHIERTEAKTIFDGYYLSIRFPAKEEISDMAVH
jgi:hypothetical protein